ncbi:helix-turn-helix domain-containing protein [Flavobacterium sp. '19STA2R22 D10 B1']|uniref:helix-turn-helix domain-containing protein n=1 Tax=Flavobacterium aerium TaxID=3037261 RepID=UPI00278C5C97|nr:helix-turn-helix transcriptional regulator [Flavobacterium sp. '19STA2R22 D10 B1']
MTADTIPFKKNHHGRNVRRLREMLGVKQEAIAVELEMTQQNFSVLEQKEEIEEKVLDKIAKALKIPVEAIKNMTEEATISYINTFNAEVTSTGAGGTIGNHNHSTFSFNPVDKIVELYERLDNEKAEKIALLEKLLQDKKI